MSERHDPATGCGLMLFGLGFAVVIFWSVLIAAVLDVGPFA